MRHAEPRQINEITNRNLTSNQRVGSSSLSGRATRFKDLSGSSRINKVKDLSRPSKLGIRALARILPPAYTTNSELEE
jgi:hypothetical protein